MIKLTETQRTVIEQGSETKYDDIRELGAIKKYSKPIQQKIIDGMLARNLLTKKKEGKKTILFLSEKAYAAIGNPAAEEHPNEKFDPNDDPGAEVKATAKKSASDKPADAKPKVKGQSKKRIVIDMLNKGATIEELEKATGWKRPSVFGSKSNYEKELGLKAPGVKNADGVLVYKFEEK